MQAKVCGLTTSEQVKTCVSHGANFCMSRLSLSLSLSLSRLSAGVTVARDSLPTRRVARPAAHVGLGSAFSSAFIFRPKSADEFTLRRQKQYISIKTVSNHQHFLLENKNWFSWSSNKTSASTKIAWVIQWVPCNLLRASRWMEVERWITSWLETVNPCRKSC